ncbi:hypothetical protein GCK32_005294 [Trichostrongylus colubriformis]|uniref:Uncharacterized protein n=1 Tax=Trichostrongylus colubriformis TaxID=6319 RepID=A0AAN8FJX4_TRICO
MTRVTPTSLESVPSVPGSRIGFLITMAAKMLGVVSRRFERRESEEPSVHTVETGGRSAADTPSLPPVYQQSSTRRLAFGSTPYDSSNPQKDFYNNSTLVNLSKLFCVAVLLAAFLLVMTRGFTHFVPNENNSTSTASYFF